MGNISVIKVNQLTFFIYSSDYFVSKLPSMEVYNVSFDFYFLCAHLLKYLNKSCIFTNIHIYTPLFSQRIKHPRNTPFLLFHVGMDVKIEGCRNVCMTQKGTYCLVVAAAFYTSGGKAMAETVVFQVGDANLLHQLVIVVTVGARLRGFLVVRQNVIFVVDQYGAMIKLRL